MNKCLIVLLWLSLSSTPAYAERTKIDSLDAALKQLKLDLPQQKTRAFNWFNGRNTKVVITKTHPNPLLKPYLGSESKGLRRAVRRAFIRWARPEDTNALVGLIKYEVNGPYHLFGFPSLTALFRVNPKRGWEYFAEHIAKEAKDFRIGGIASVVKVGAGGEEAVLPLLKSKNHLVLEVTVKVLLVIATDKSIPALQQLAKGTEYDRLKRTIETVIRKAKARQQ